jgi:hypothetical protein
VNVVLIGTPLKRLGQSSTADESVLAPEPIVKLGGGFEGSCFRFIRPESAQPEAQNDLGRRNRAARAPASAHSRTETGTYPEELLGHAEASPFVERP